jgi:hypothetical protein
MSRPEQAPAFRRGEHVTDGGYQYLATVYSKHPLGLDIAWREACHHAAQFIKAGIPTFCPIAHTHPIAMHGLLNPYDHDIWLPADRPLMEAAAGLVVVTSEGWLDSVGIAAEIEYFNAARKPIVYWQPGDTVPEGLCQGSRPGGVRPAIAVPRGSHATGQGPG